MVPLAKAFRALLGSEKFVFAATEKISAWRTQMGWPELAPDDVLCSFASEGEMRRLDALWDESEVVICSMRDIDRMRARVSRGRMTFYASERWWKPPYGRVRLLFPKWRGMVKVLGRLSLSDKFHYLPIGPYACHDLSPGTFPRERCHLWGYFLDRLPDCGAKDGGPLQVMFAGRMLKWKHPEDVVRAFAMLRDEHPGAKLVMAGAGERAGRVASLARSFGVESGVRLAGAMPMPQIWDLMDKSHVVVQSSDPQEGWGAVINEAMSRRCAVVASRQSGAAAAMLKDGENALLYDCGDWRALGRRLVELAADRRKLHRISSEAKMCIDTLWSAENAARRFLLSAEAVLAEKGPVLFEDGPMSAISGP
jgi:glycosyltransferase involved in cell wall biosynthesis